MADNDEEIFKRLNANDIDIAVLKTWRQAIDLLLPTFVTRVEFSLVKIIVYGLSGTILSSVLVALISKVIVKP